MLLVEVSEHEVDLTDLTNDEVQAMYAESVEDYCDCLNDAYEGYGEYQQMCAEAVVAVADEAKRRGLFLRTLH